MAYTINGESADLPGPEDVGSHPVQGHPEVQWERKIHDRT